MKNKVAPKTAKRTFFKRDPLTSVLTLLVIFFASQLAAGLIVSLYPSLKNWTGDQGSDWIQNSVIAQFFYIVLAESFAIWLVFAVLKKIKIAKAYIGVKKPAFRDIAYALSGYAVYFVTYIVIITVASHYSHLINVDQPQKIGFDSAHGNQLYLVFISLVVLPPIAEEIMFRGFLYTSFRQKFRMRYAMILTSILFGLAHLQFGSGAPLLWVAALDTFTLSLVLCYLREKTDSLVPSMLLHALKNLIAFIALFHGAF
jgi:membrane protease YdiL (CAAX protease family)